MKSNKQRSEFGPYHNWKRHKKQRIKQKQRKNEEKKIYKIGDGWATAACYSPHYIATVYAIHFYFAWNQMESLIACIGRTTTADCNVVPYSLCVPLVCFLVLLFFFLISFSFNALDARALWELCDLIILFFSFFLLSAIFLFYFLFWLFVSSFLYIFRFWFSGNIFERLLPFTLSLFFIRIRICVAAVSAGWWSVLHLLGRKTIFRANRNESIAFICD